MNEKTRVLATISGKGGVGKTTVALGAAYALRDLGYSVGILDIDIESSSLGDALGLGYRNLTMDAKLNPADIDGIKAVSLSMFLDKDWEDTPTLIDESRVFLLIQQMFDSVEWGDLDYLVVDTPPGTGPELRALAQRGVDGLILVTAAQRLSEMPVRRLVKMAREELGLAVIGVVSNDPYHTENTVTSADAISQRYGLDIIAIIPWDKAITIAMDEQKPLDVELFHPVADKIEAHFHPAVTEQGRVVAALKRKGKKRGEIAKELGITPGRVGQLTSLAKKGGLIPA
jgi:ATP-binding protein involved in chromosome partitioning